MKSPERITIALDQETAGLFKQLREDLGLSQSELMREAVSKE
ncbi:MAG: ribbon-helix-helix protein, CopG family [Methanotrichaceae archaeon]|nr:ribbon-helix-helix protein, CopG family [Methanotrichaceae archaeon]